MDDLQSPLMRYLAAAAVGVLGAIAATIAWIVLRFGVPIVVPHLISRMGFNQSGSGGSGAVIGSWSIMLAALAGFIAGCSWSIWRR